MNSLKKTVAYRIIDRFDGEFALRDASRRRRQRCNAFVEGPFVTKSTQKEKQTSASRTYSVIKFGRRCFVGIEAEGANVMM
jgi:hypothetical protein